MSYYSCLNTKIGTIILETGVRAYPWVEQMLARLPDIEITEVPDIREMIRSYQGLPYPADPYAAKRLLLGKHRGPFLKDCPCSSCSQSCGYYFLHLGIGCPIDCTYCFLQKFCDTSFPVLLVNFDDLEHELAAFAQKQRPARMGTGEMTDSLIFEPLTGFARHLVQLFARWPHLLLELKTKTTYVESLLDVAIPNVVIAWSLNPPEIASHEEPHAPEPIARLHAAQKCVAAGYRVGFHFDPIIAYPDWEVLYPPFIAQMFSLIPPEKIAWISLGTLRIFPALRDIIRHRFPQSRLLLAEMVAGYDNKLRYFKARRIEIYRKFVAWLRQMGGANIPVYLCMESYDICQKVLPKPGHEQNV